MGFLASHAKLFWVSNGFNIKRDHSSRFVFNQGANKVSDVQVDFIASGNQLRKAQALGHTARQDRTQNAAALRHQCDTPGLLLVRFKRSASRKRNPVSHIDQANGIGAQQSHFSSTGQ